MNVIDIDNLLVNNPKINSAYLIINKKSSQKTAIF